MHGHQHGHGHHGHWGKWAAGRQHRGFGFGGRHGKGGFGGRDPGDWMRAKRMLAQGDLRLVALALIEQAPRHGYEIIKLLEEKTADWYSPSPGIVYPTLTYLEEAGYVTASTDGAKRLYTITEEGKAYLKENREVADVILARLDALGEKVNRWRRRFGDDEAESDRREDMPRSIRGAFQDLSEAVRETLGKDREATGRIIDIIERVANELRAK